MADTVNGDARANRLLALLPEAEYAAVLEAGELVELGIKEAAYPAHTPIAHVYFPLAAVFSMVTEMDDGTIMEVATIGRDGMVGLSAFLGSTTSPLTTFSQVAGASLRLELQAFRALAVPGTVLHEALHRYTQALFVFTAQAVACNRLHDVAARCARWLLLTHDRVPGDTFQLTHEFLAQMLGVRRASVSEVAAQLQRAGLITYERGVVTVLNRPGLEVATCECYRVIAAEFDRMLG